MLKKKKLIAENTNLKDSINATQTELDAMKKIHQATIDDIDKAIKILEQINPNVRLKAIQELKDIFAKYDF